MVQRNPAATILALVTLCCATPAGAEPYPAFASAPRVRVAVSPYTQDPATWSAERVKEAMTLADAYLDACGIDLEPGPLQPLRPGDDRDLSRLWRTKRGEELVIVLRPEGDGRRYPLAGVASLWKYNGRWIGEAPWGPVTLALAQVIGGGKLKTWPPPSGEGSAEAMGKARLAMVWAAARGWVTLAPAVAEGHCEFLRKRFIDLGKQKQRAAWVGWPKPDEARLAAGWPLALPAAPTAMLASDVPNQDAYAIALRVGDVWRMAVARANGPPQLEERPLPARGEGLALVRVGGTSLLLSTLPEGGVYAQWWHASEARRAQFRLDRTLEGCSRVLVADALYPAEPSRGADDDPGAAVVVCPERVFHLTPLPAHDERSDALVAARWATLTRWGPGRSLLLTGTEGGLRGLDLRPHAAPAEWKPPAAAEALWRARPLAPIWWAAGGDPVQLADGALHGLAGGPRPLGKDATAVFDPQAYRSVRARKTPAGTELRLDGLYGGGATRATLPPGALWAVHRGGYAPHLWAVVPAAEGPGWRLVAPARRTAK